jgi:hypothetical protein
MQQMDNPIQVDQSGDCCRTAEDGSTYCAVPQNGQAASCNTTAANSNVVKNSLWKTVRGWLMFGVACLTSPCCTPLIVPLALALLAGTPVAAWLGQNLGWVYSGLTLLSIVSFVLAVRWLNKPKSSQPNTVRPSDIPVIVTSKRS